MTVGERVRRLRERRGWTATDLAAKCGVSLSAISKVETGRRPVGSKLRQRIADALEIHPDALEEEAAPGAVRRVPLVEWSDLLKTALKGVPTGGAQIVTDAAGERLIALRLPQSYGPTLPVGATVLANLADDSRISGRFYLSMWQPALGGRIRGGIEIIQAGDEDDPWRRWDGATWINHGGEEGIVLGRLIRSVIDL
jgi:transcriptional regulator with XRE-family HTH domain